MDKFKYKLDPVLKLRNFEKKKVEIHLGQINKKILDTENNINEVVQQINEAYSVLNNSKDQKIENSYVLSLPHLLKVKTKELENLQEELNTNHRLRNEVIQKLNEVTGRFKIIEKDKQKKEISFKKESQKKIEQEIQDLFLISKGGVIS
ncbi:MAG: hypothetical protein CME61_02970 [Halobacteriovoraceae bacterium]|nr:hypothetical protein [Halobacteriovoraceae bacterium]